MFKKGRSRTSLSKQESRNAYIFLSPILVLYTVFALLPIGMLFYLSFTEYSVLTPPQWIGLENYKYLFLKDTVFIKSMINTSCFVVGTIFPTLFLGLLFAILVNRSLRGKGIIRSCIYLPYVTPVIAAALVWQFLYEPFEGGFMNYLLSWLGIKPINWLGTIRWALPSIMFMSIWRNVGFSMVLFLAGLQGIPERYYEAAKIDGANSVQQFWHITLPLLKPVILFILVLVTIGAFQVFQESYIMTEGGPALSTMTIVYWFYIVSFRSLSFGKGSAISFILAMMIFILSIFYLKVLKFREG